MSLYVGTFRGMLFAGHDETHTYWTSDPSRAAWWRTPSACAEEMARAGFDPIDATWFEADLASPCTRRRALWLGLALTAGCLLLGVAVLAQEAFL